MKNFYIYPLGKDFPILVKGNYSAFIRSLEKGEYQTFRFEIAENIYFKKMIIHSANDRSSNRGKWFAHCNGYNMNLVLYYNNIISVNTCAYYRVISTKPRKNERYL